MGFWADKLGNGAPPVEQRPYMPTPQYVPQPQQHQQPQAHTQQPVTVHMGGLDIPLDVLERGNVKNGAARHERQVCPECGDPRYFTRGHQKLKKLNVKTGQMVSPSPLCEACGYNGMFEQYGNQVALMTEE